MAVFKVRLDTINAHRYLDGRYPRHLTDTFSWIQEEQEITNMEIKDIQSGERIAFHKEMADIVHGGYLACLFLKQEDKGRFGKLKTILVNGYLNLNASDSHYPKTLHEALHLLNGYTTIVSSRRSTTAITTTVAMKEWLLWSMIYPASTVLDVAITVTCLRTTKYCRMQRRKRCE